MYNPYNWEIKGAYGHVYSNFKRNSWESDEDYYNRLMYEYAKYMATESVCKMGIELTQMNLNDSIQLDDYETIMHDISILKRKIEEHEIVKKRIKEINKKLNTLL